MKIIMIPYKIILCELIIAVCVLTSGCKKFVDVDAPSGQLVTATVFTNDKTVNSALAGMYSTMVFSSAYNLQFNLAFATGCSADETVYFTSSADFDPFMNNSIAANNDLSFAIWGSLYQSIYQANAIMAGINNSSGGISDAMKTEATGEAKFIRAFCYFYLVNLWGDVPLALTTDQKINNSLARSSKELVYEQIIKDLTDAQNSLLEDYSWSGAQRTRPNKYAATALLARAYLYTKDWAKAQTNASSVIESSSLFNLLSAADLGGIFVKNNSEAILQFDASPTGKAGDGYTQEGQYYAFDITTIPDFQLSASLVAAFETGDLRFTNWVGVNTYQGTTYYYPSKYKQSTTNTTASGEYCTYLRLAEQYLIRAEAMVQQNNLSGAIEDINVIRNRAGLLNTSAVTQTDILLAIEQERRIELFGEYGHRWNDLRRTGRADIVLGAQKPEWTPNAALYPIPKLEITNNSKLTQNPGYN